MPESARDAARQTGPALEKMYQLALWLVPLIEKLPRSHKFTLGDRVQSAALDTLLGLVQATYSRQRRGTLRDVNLRLHDLRLLLRLMADLRLIDLRRFEHGVRRLDEVGRLVGGWLRADAARAGTAEVESPSVA